MSDVSKRFLSVCFALILAFSFSANIYAQQPEYELLDCEIVELVARSCDELGGDRPPPDGP